MKRFIWGLLTVTALCALLVLPVLMAGVLSSRLPALATASAVTLLLLVTAFHKGLQGGDLPGLLSQAGLAGAAMEVAHCKMTLSPDTGTDLAVRNLVRNEAGSESIYRLADEITDGELLLNLRAEGEPDHLRALALASLERAAAELSASADVTHIEHFRPGRPQPTHRMVAP